MSKTTIEGSVSTDGDTIYVDGMLLADALRALYPHERDRESSMVPCQAPRVFVRQLRITVEEA